MYVSSKTTRKAVYTRIIQKAKHDHGKCVDYLQPGVASVSLKKCKSAGLCFSSDMMAAVEEEVLLTDRPSSEQVSAHLLQSRLYVTSAELPVPESMIPPR